MCRPPSLQANRNHMQAATVVEGRHDRMWSLAHEERPIPMMPPSIQHAHRVCFLFDGSRS